MADGRHYEPIKYTFSNDEIRALGESLAREAQTILDLRERKKASVATLGAEILRASERATVLATCINAGYEVRRVECLVLYDDPKPGLKKIVRIDTNEVVDERPMTSKELQGTFGFEDPGER